MYKLIAFDVDGTLLNSKLEITEELQERLDKLMSEGIKIVIATGRSYSGIDQILKDVGTTMPCATFNGANVYDHIEQKIIFEKTLVESDAQKVLELSLSIDVDFIIWSDNKLYSNRLSEPVADYGRRFNCIPIITDDFDKAFKDGVTKFLWFSTSEDMPLLKQSISGLVPEGVEYFTSRPEFLEFINKNVSKGVALDFIANMFDIKQSEVMAFGDGENDIAMIKYAGFGVAMGNGKQELKDVADYVTDSNDENGILNALDKFL